MMFQIHRIAHSEKKIPTCSFQHCADGISLTSAPSISLDQSDSIPESSYELLSESS